MASRLCRLPIRNRCEGSLLAATAIGAFGVLSKRPSDGSGSHVDSCVRCAPVAGLNHPAAMCRNPWAYLSYKTVEYAVAVREGRPEAENRVPTIVAHHSEIARRRMRREGREATPQQIDAAVRADLDAQRDIAHAKESFERFEARSLQVVRVQLLDARAVDDLQLDTSGFVCLVHTSSIEDWDDMSHVQDRYRDEMAKLVGDLVGTDRAFTAAVVSRTCGKLESGQRGPVLNVHNDFTEGLKEELASEFLSPGSGNPVFVGEVVQQMRRAGVTEQELRCLRIIVVNVWRNIGEQPLIDCPLAVCDRRSVSQDDLISQNDKGRQAEIYDALYHPNHQWYWFPQMTINEVLLIKTYDSSNHGNVCGTLHTAFLYDDVAMEEVPPRRSCDLRVLCLLPLFRE